MRARGPAVGAAIAAAGLALAPAPARAGDPGPLCAAVGRADAVVEVELQVKDSYPASYRAKGWAPEAKHLAATLATARVAARHKGDPTGWTPKAEDLPLGSLGIKQWEQLFAAQTVRALVLLQREGAGWRSAGWLEDSGDCAISPCWEPLRQGVLACLGAPAAR